MSTELYTHNFPDVVGSTSPRLDAVTRLAAMNRYAPRMPWDQFYGTIFRPTPGEHVAIIGRTGNGKTALQNALLPKWPFVTIFATKPQDDTIDRLIASRHYALLRHWRRLSPTEVPRRILWPDARALDSDEHQREVFRYALSAIFMEAGRPKRRPVGWAIAIDELWYFSNQLGLSREVTKLLFQGRSLGHSMILATQRPSEVPVAMYSQSTHLFFFEENDRRNLDRLSEVNSRSSAAMRMIVPALEKHQVLYVNAETKQMFRTRVPPYIAEGVRS